MTSSTVLSSWPRLGDAHVSDDVRGSDQSVFAEVLRDAVDVLERSGVDYLLMGGLGYSCFGHPRWTHDIDFFIRPDEAQIALAALSESGFHTEATDPWWLYKAFRRGVMTDLIFRSAGDIYLDEEMMRHAITRQVGLSSVRVISPEDLLVVKAVTASEASPYHFYDALSLFASVDLDWEYLVDRALHCGVRRVLSLLVYAHANDLNVPASAVESLYSAAFR